MRSGTLRTSRAASSRGAHRLRSRPTASAQPYYAKREENQTMQKRTRLDCRLLAPMIQARKQRFVFTARARRRLAQRCDRPNTTTPTPAYVRCSLFVLALEHRERQNVTRFVLVRARQTRPQSSTAAGPSTLKQLRAQPEDCGSVDERFNARRGGE